MTSDDSKTFCQSCEQYIESSKYILHERMCSLNVKRCPKCDKPFNLIDLDDHIKLEHSFTICDLCGSKFTNKEIENHKKNCDYRLIPCKFCELNVIFQELEEHENICGSTTKLCEKCGSFIEKKNFDNHICEKKESEYLSEHIKIDKVEEDKKEKKKIKYNKKNKKQSKKKEVEQMNKLENNIEDLDMNMIYSSQEIQKQIKALKKYENKKKDEENNKQLEDKKEKKKNKKKKLKEKEDEKEEDNKINNKNKKGKKNKTTQNKINKINGKDYSDDEEDYYIPKKKINLHNIKFDLPPEEYENYNKGKNVYHYDYNNFILEENMIQEAIKQSLLDK